MKRYVGVLALLLYACGSSERPIKRPKNLENGLYANARISAYAIADGTSKLVTRGHTPYCLRTVNVRTDIIGINAYQYEFSKRRDILIEEYSSPRNGCPDKILWGEKVKASGSFIRNSADGDIIRVESDVQGQYLDHY